MVAITPRGTERTISLRAFCGPGGRPGATAGQGSGLWRAEGGDHGGAGLGTPARQSVTTPAQQTAGPRLGLGNPAGRTPATPEARGLRPRLGKPSGTAGATLPAWIARPRAGLAAGPPSRDSVPAPGAPLRPRARRGTRPRPGAGATSGPLPLPPHPSTGKPSGLNSASAHLSSPPRVLCGHIVQVSSVGGRVASPGLSAYQSAKWAVGGFSEVLAAETASFGVKVTVIEPGGMRTDWGAASMRVPEASGPYQDLMAEAAKLRKDFDTRAPGDPVRVARAILTVASLDEPPVRLLLGSDAYAYGRAAWSGRVAEDAKWEELSRSTDFPTTER
ncbi:SDR family NAD(P)-dependent oxidoreductase [Streptomyces sp. NPDC004959]|uniref:SDR family NAD(P)-dependent oxidoreductase n=1 Tax=Streptomyces sp. NPDC004959 TaxID=3154673 RepID=UPI0033AEB4C4